MIEPDALGKLRGNDDARRSEIAHYDADTQAVLEWLQAEETVLSDQIAAFGFCIGGHLAFRAARQDSVKAASLLLSHRYSQR